MITTAEPLATLGSPFLSTDGPSDATGCALLLGFETSWSLEFKSVIRRLGLRLKRLDNPLDAFAHLAELDPLLLVVDQFNDDELTLLDLCDAIRIPRQLRPLEVLVTTRVRVPAGEDLAELGIDDVLDAGGEPSDYQALLLQHLRVAEARRGSLVRERDILDSLPNALFIVDRSLTLWNVNRRAAQLLRLESADQLQQHLGKPLREALRFAAESVGRRDGWERLATVLAQALRSGTAEFACRELLGDEERSIAGKITKLEHASELLLVDLRDVTDHDQALRREARRERLATIGNLAVGVAHEIQNPNTFTRINAANVRMLFAAVRPLLEVAGEEYSMHKIGAFSVSDVSARMEAAIAGMEKACLRIAEVIDTLKIFGRDDGTTTSAVDLRSAIREATLLTEHERRGKAALIVDLPEELPRVRANATELSQVFINLIENALHAFAAPDPQARGDGPAEIRIHLERVDSHAVVVAVSDNGPGIDESLHAKVFRPYFSTRAQGEGTGLGLSISSDIVHRFGGDLTLHSRRGKGATFRMTLLPAMVGDDAMPESQEASHGV